MTIRSFLHLAPPAKVSSFSDVDKETRRLYDTLFSAMQGKLQCVNEITLTANVATTVLQDLRISIQSCIGFDARTANAAAELGNGTMYILDANRAKGQVTITHANNAQADRTFFISIIG